jgi:hypothetical protein
LKVVLLETSSLLKACLLQTRLLQTCSLLKTCLLQTLLMLLKVKRSIVRSSQAKSGSQLSRIELTMRKEKQLVLGALMQAVPLSSGEVTYLLISPIPSSIKIETSIHFHSLKAKTEALWINIVRVWVS